MISLIGVTTLAVRHGSKSEWLNKDLPQEISGNNTLGDLDFGRMLINTKSRFGYRFFFEAFVILLCPVPYWDCIITLRGINPTLTNFVPVYYLLSDFILALMFIRVMFLFRASINYSIFMDIYSKKLCKSYGFTANVRFALKCFVRSNPGTTVFVMLISSVLMAAYLIRIFELPYGVAIGSK